MNLKESPASPGNEKGRQVYMDILSILSAFAVVLMHCTDKRLKVDGSFGWYFSVLLQAVSIWAVPVFFMLSGANLLDYRKKYSTAVFLKKRMARVILPFLAWSVLYAVWKNVTGQLEIHSIYEFFQLFFNNQILSIFWFFYPLIAGYFCMPVLSGLVCPKDRHADKKMAWYLFGLSFFNLSLIPLIRTVSGLSLSQFASPVGGSPICFFMLGWLLKNEQMKPAHRKILYFGGAVSIILLFFSTAVLSLESGKFDKTFMTSVSVFTMILAAAVFVFVKHCPLTAKLASSPKACKRLSQLSGAGLGIYFIQKIPMWYLGKIVNQNRIRYMLLGSIAIYFGCAAVVLLLKKVPLLRHLVP